MGDTLAAGYFLAALGNLFREPGMIFDIGFECGIDDPVARTVQRCGNPSERFHSRSIGSN